LKDDLDGRKKEIVWLKENFNNKEDLKLMDERIE
jgi:hypothetical protein